MLNILLTDKNRNDSKRTSRTSVIHEIAAKKWGCGVNLAKQEVSNGSYQWRSRETSGSLWKLSKNIAFRSV